MGRLIVHDLARTDLDEIADWIARDDSAAALRLYSVVEEACARLADFPGAGARCGLGKYSDLRMWPLGGRYSAYVIFYLPLEGGVEVLRILHGARDLRSLF